jgi:hypothetical protein
LARLAFYTFAVAHETFGHPKVQGFWDRIIPVMQSAAAHPGYIAHDSVRGPRWGEDAAPRFYDPSIHPPIVDAYGTQSAAPATLSLWKDVASVADFAYHGLHREALNKRKEWFRTPEWPSYVAWWVGDDEVPTRAEAASRLEYLYDHGPTPYAFNFKQPFDADGNPAPLSNRALEEHAE